MASKSGSTMSPTRFALHVIRQPRLNCSPRSLRPAFAAARGNLISVPISVWSRVALISLGGFFEFYDIFFTGYIAPGLVRSGILTPTTPGLFGTTGIAGFVAAMFSGLFIGTALVSFVADRFGRRTIFTYSLLWYTAASVVMAFQHDVFGLNLWRFISGIGVGVELVTIDTYLAELVPADLRGRAFAINQAIQFCAVPVVALLAWLLVPRAPFGLDGWRWVVLLGASGAIVVWWIRRRVPESPRWLSQSVNRGSFFEMWQPPYRTRSIMLIIFHLFQTVGFYGFSNWVPTLLVKRGIAITSSLRYTFIIAIAAPFGPLLAAAIADKLERKWQIVAVSVRRRSGRPVVRSNECRGATDLLWGAVDAGEQHPVVLLPRLSGRTLPDADPSSRCRIRLFLEPHLGGLQLVCNRILSGALRRGRCFQPDRRQHGHRDARHRIARSENQQPGVRNDFELVCQSAPTNQQEAASR